MLRCSMFVAFSLAATPAAAAELTALEAGSLEIGSFRGVVFYTAQPEAYHVVATIADGEGGLPVRFEATLGENQKLAISVPGKLGEQGDMVVISRIGERLAVAPAPAAKSELIVAGPPASTD
jgi:hypothetical protein